MVKVGDVIEILMDYQSGALTYKGDVFKVAKVHGDFFEIEADGRGMCWTFDLCDLNIGYKVINKNREMFDAYYTVDEVINGEEAEALRKSKNAKGLKFDNDKVPLDLLPYDALIEIGKVLKAGEVKYGTANWTNGIEMRRLLSAAMRHIGQFNNGEDIDDETQTIHLANAACNLMFAIWMFKNRPDLDNRWAKK